MTNDHQTLRLAVEAECDPRTAARYLAGEQVRPLARMRLERSAKKLKIKPKGRSVT